MINKISSLLFGDPFATSVSADRSNPHKKRTINEYRVNEIYSGIPIAFIALLGILFFSFLFVLATIVIIFK